MMSIKRLLWILAFLSVASASANVMFSTPPTRYVITGDDRYGRHAYTIDANVDSTDDVVTLSRLKVVIYNLSIDVPPALLRAANNPDVGDISVVNDEGVEGSYFYIDIPFGKAPVCASNEALDRKTIHIGSSGTMNGKGGLSADVYDPCED